VSVMEVFLYVLLVSTYNSTRCISTTGARSIVGQLLSRFEQIVIANAVGSNLNTDYIPIHAQCNA
jgi:hypothetical protein